MTIKINSNLLDYQNGTFSQDDSTLEANGISIGYPGVWIISEKTEKEIFFNYIDRETTNDLDGSLNCIKSWTYEAKHNGTTLQLKVWNS